ncbi:MAG: DUF1018 domain-containing protein [Rhodocyclaceae bacterium]|jgi:phage gp16-like protein|nr:DUF1018 domain-containing protein [Rhodocyclaceae bacterium]
MSRRDLYAMIHLGAKRMGWDEDIRRAWMEKHTGKRSSTECTEPELARLADELRGLGALDDGRPLGKADRGGKGSDRPSRQQWKKAAVLCKQLGFTGGIDDPAFAAFVARVAKVDNPRFLTRTGLRNVLLGLENWIKNRSTPKTTLPKGQPV